jgi:hypothetical protein
MRRSLCAFVFLGSFALAAAPPDPKTLPDAPGPLHPYNANGKYKGRYHDPISDRGLEPVALFFTQDWQSDAFKKLLTQLNGVAEDNKDLRLAVYVVVLDDALTPATADDGTPEKRDKRAGELNVIEDHRVDVAGKLEKLAGDLPHVVVGLDDRADAAKYVSDDAGSSFWLLDKLRVWSHLDQKDVKLDDKQVEAVVADLTAKLKDVKETRK